MTTRSIATPDRWRALCAPMRGAAVDDEYQRLRRAWGGWSRAYHTLTHLEACLQEFDAHRALANQPSEVEFALWYHDAVYKTWRKDNESQSAAWAAQFLTRLGSPQPLIERMRAMILATTHQPGPLGGDTALVVDIDLSILGQPVVVYDEFERQVRREYWWVPKRKYVAGRTAVLRSFLARESIYHHSVFRERYEALARENLQRAVARLQG